MSYIFRARKNQAITVTERQFSIIVGSLLGDAYISALGKIQFEHSQKAEAYLQWKFQELEGVRYANVSRVSREKNGSLTSSCRFWTRQFFRPLRQIWYGDGKKHLATEALESITPLALAVWHMDDGHYEKAKKRCILATDGFSDEDRIRLAVFFRERFDLHMTIRKSGKMALTQGETEKFFALIMPYRIACMAYKFPDP